MRITKRPQRFAPDHRKVTRAACRRPAPEFGLSQLPLRPVGSVLDRYALGFDLGSDSIGLGKPSAGPGVLAGADPVLHPLHELRTGSDRLRDYIQYRVDAAENRSRCLQRALVDAIAIELGVCLTHEGEKRSERDWRIQIIEQRCPHFRFSIFGDFLELRGCRSRFGESLREIADA